MDQFSTQLYPQTLYLSPIAMDIWLNWQYIVTVMINNEKEKEKTDWYSQNKDCFLQKMSKYSQLKKYLLTQDGKE